MTHLKITPKIHLYVSSSALVFFVDKLCDQLASAAVVVLRFAPLCVFSQLDSENY